MDGSNVSVYEKLPTKIPKTPQSTDDLLLTNSLKDFCRFVEPSSSPLTFTSPNNRKIRNVSTVGVQFHLTRPSLYTRLSPLH